MRVCRVCRVLLTYRRQVDDAAGRVRRLGSRPRTPRGPVVPSSHRRHPRGTAARRRRFAFSVFASPFFFLTRQAADPKHAARPRAKLRLEARLQVRFWAGWWRIGDRSGADLCVFLVTRVGGGQFGQARRVTQHVLHPSTQQGAHGDDRRRLNAPRTTTHHPCPLHPLRPEREGLDLCAYMCVCVAINKIFGAFCSESWQVSDKYYGTGNSFLYMVHTVLPSPPHDHVCVL